MALARILVVEDDEKLNHIVCAYLSGVGYQATGCLNGEEALKKLEEEKQNLVRVTDILSELTKQLEPLEKQSETATTIRATETASTPANPLYKK